jgi:ATP-binding protein involved in chromosome partitioning
MSITQHHAHVLGPCGDTMGICLQVEDCRIISAVGDSDGCGSSWAAVTAAARLAQDLPLPQARSITPAAIKQDCGLDAEHDHCAHLAVITLRAVIDLATNARTPVCQSACQSDESGYCSSDCADCSSCTSDEKTTESKPKPEDGSRRIKQVVLVLSGKGGVGKSSVATAIASTLAANGQRVGLLDADVHGPSIPRLTDMRGQGLCQIPGRGMLPQLTENGLHLCSAGLLVDEKRAFIQRGPAKSGLITSMLRDLHWGPLDCMVVDLPPGTGDEALTVTQHFGKRCQAILVTTPQDLAFDDVQRCLAFCTAMELPILGIIENMSGFRCPDCQHIHQIFAGDAGQQLADRSRAPLLATLPLDPALTTASAWQEDDSVRALCDRIASALGLPATASFTVPTI